MDYQPIVTKHKLLFEVAQPKNALSPFPRFRVGTCEGQWFSTDDCFVILSLINSQPGNGHLDDVLEWFEHSCNREHKNLLIIECINAQFWLHLVTKRGFTEMDTTGFNCIKVFNKKAYKKMLKNGNQIIDKTTLRVKQDFAL